MIVGLFSSMPHSYKYDQFAPPFEVIFGHISGGKWTFYDVFFLRDAIAQSYEKLAMGAELHLKLTFWRAKILKTKIAPSIIFKR